MRTVEQVANDFKSADPAVKAAEQNRDKFKRELEEILAAAEAALGVPKKPVYRSVNTPSTRFADVSIGGDGR